MHARGHLDNKTMEYLTPEDPKPGTVLLVEDTGVPREIHQPVACHRQTLSHNVVSCTPRHDRDSK
jgi:hypothetical protein